MINGIIDKFVLFLYYFSQKRGKIARVDHKKIYAAIISKNVSAAADRMQEHLVGSRNNILQFLLERE